jgi:ribosomal protein S18 acetylase RimI-like enzyme
MTVIVAPITAEDADSFHACLGAVARERKYLALLDAPPLERTREFVTLNVEKMVLQVVAKDRGHVVGWCDIQSPWHDTLKHTGSVGMGLLPEYRGRGLGEQLLKACLERARASGVTRVELEVRSDNESGLRLYRRVGFKVEGLKERGMRVDGKYIETTVMALLL